MALENIYWWPVSDFFAHGTLSFWSVDVNIPPQTVYAFVSLSCAELHGDTSIDPVKVPPIGPVCRIASYSTRDPSTGHIDTHSGGPGIFDNNVVTVSFEYEVANANGDLTLQIFGFG
jgi:hypothetical protein